MDINELKIVADSSADTFAFDGVSFASAPLKIRTDSKEYTDDGTLDVAGMVDDLAAYKGRSSSSCPSPADWLACFGGAKYVFCITITATLSGSYNSACVAKKQYEEDHPDRRVFVFNSLSAGGELLLVMEKVRELAKTDADFDEICAEAEKYAQSTALIFMLESMKNLANNGRVSQIAARAAGLLGIRVVGKASERGDLQPLEKCRGENKAVESIFSNMLEIGYIGGKVRIGHCCNPEGADKLCARIRARFADADIRVYQSGGLCSFYEEKGGLMIGFEH
ncbi:MAG: DegV family protein [Clostridia bacterium]|nr:DegV family protein [Clostridia bacterium]